MRNLLKILNKPRTGSFRPSKAHQGVYENNAVVWQNYFMWD